MEKTWSHQLATSRISKVVAGGEFLINPTPCKPDESGSPPPPNTHAMFGT